MGAGWLSSKLVSVVDGASRIWMRVSNPGEFDEDGYQLDVHNPMLHHHQVPNSHIYGVANYRNRAGLDALGIEESDVSSFGRRASILFASLRPWLLGAASLVVLSGVFFLWKFGLNYQLGGQSSKPTPTVKYALAPASLADKMKEQVKDPSPPTYSAAIPDLFATSTPVPLITAPPTYQPPLRRPPVAWSTGATTRVGRVTFTEDVWSEAVREYAAEVGFQSPNIPVDQSNPTGPDSNNPKIGNRS